MYAATGGPNVKWGGWAPLAPPLATALGCTMAHRNMQTVPIKVSNVLQHIYHEIDSPIIFLNYKAG